jgi:uncharacterized protein with PIN domain
MSDIGRAPWIPIRGDTCPRCGGKLETAIRPLSTVHDDLYERVLVCLRCRRERAERRTIDMESEDAAS